MSGKLEAEVKKVASTSGYDLDEHMHVSDFVIVFYSAFIRTLDLEKDSFDECLDVLRLDRDFLKSSVFKLLAGFHDAVLDYPDPLYFCSGRNFLTAVLKGLKEHPQNSRAWTLRLYLSEYAR